MRVRFNEYMDLHYNISNVSPLSHSILGSNFYAVGMFGRFKQEHEIEYVPTNDIGNFEQEK